MPEQGGAPAPAPAPTPVPARAPAEAQPAAELSYGVSAEPVAAPAAPAAYVVPAPASYEPAPTRGHATVNPMRLAAQGSSAPTGALHATSDQAQEWEEPPPKEYGCIGGMKKNVTDWLNTKRGMISMSVFSICLSIWSIAVVASAYKALSARSSDVAGIITNWGTKPVVTLGFGSSISGGCPGTHELITGATWPGVQSGAWCGCDSSSRNSSSTVTCTSTQSRQDCYNSIGFIPIPVDGWSGRPFCIQRGGEAAITYKENDEGVKEWVSQRPIPTEEEPDCPDTYQKCGNGTWNANRAICWPSREECPITGYISTLSSSSETNFPLKASQVNDTGITSWRFQGAGGGAQYSLLYNRQRDGYTPEIDTDIAYKGEVCIGDGARGFDGKGGPKSNSYDSDSCESDGRWSTVASLTEDQWWKPFFDSSGQHSASSFISGLDSCRTGDTTCDFMIQSQAYKLDAHKSADSWSVLSRGEVLWKTGCGTTKEQLFDNAEPLAAATRMQRILLILNVIANVVSGFLINFLLIWNAWKGDVPCIPGDGANERYYIKFMNTWVAAISKTTKFVPLLIVTALISRIKGFYAGAAEHHCSDDTTNETISFLGKALTKAYAANVQAIVVDSVQILIASYHIVRELTDGVSIKDKTGRKG